MECAALTGISPSLIDNLKGGKPRTLELQSAHNIITLRNVEPGSIIFLTSVDLEDLSEGDAGISVNVLAITISMKRLIGFISPPTIVEERERTSARIQVRYGCNSFVKSVLSKGLGNPTVVEVIKSSCYRAG
jgi:uncharacterized protein